MNNKEFPEYSDLIDDARAMYAADDDFDVDAEWQRFQREHAALLCPNGKTVRLKRAGWWAAAAAVILLAFIIITPQVRESREMARYEGSYVEEDGQRVNDYRLIKNDIQDALTIADQAEMLAQQ